MNDSEPPLSPHVWPRDLGVGATVDPSAAGCFCIYANHSGFPVVVGRVNHDSNEGLDRTFGHELPSWAFCNIRRPFPSSCTKNWEGGFDRARAREGTSCAALTGSEDVAATMTVESWTF
jgi:hypothetical protein